MTDLHEIKTHSRREARVRRKTAAEAVPDAGERACAAFLSDIAVREGDVVALYRAIQSELDPAALVDALRARGVVTCFPVVMAEATPLEFRAADAETPFVPGAFGAAIPVEGSAVVTPTIVVAPLLSFDRRLYRLGYGGGFYDRTLERLRAAAPTRAYGYAYAAQEVEGVPIEPTDQQLDGVVTEAGLVTQHQN
jgi:5-formyltetrahydrofolate cyclo-ligase